MRFNPLKNIGPGTLVAAAFIGPGTVTTCSKAGVSFGFSLLWTLVLSIFATIILQEMAARLGLVSGKGLAEAVRGQIKQKTLRYAAVGLIIAAILIGNSAYQAGNISGGTLGLGNILGSTQVEFGSVSVNYLAPIIGTLAFIMLYVGHYKSIERILVTLVLIMSISFLITALMTSPNWSAIFSGVFIPTQPEGSILTIIGLVGTTVVPYNLFLHASLVREKWKGQEDLKKARKDTVISIILGGVVSMAIVISAAAIDSGSISNTGDLAKGLEPLYGKFATLFLGIGLFAAGITSAVTAPLAAAYVAKGCFGWDGQLKSKKFRSTWLIVLIIGTIISTFGKSPIEIIYFAQVANGLLLPVIALFLLWAANRSEIMQRYTNSMVQNIISGLIIVLTVILAAKTLFTVFSV